MRLPRLAATLVAPLAASLAISAALAVLSAAPAAARPGSGELSCNVAGGFGYAVVGQRGITCVYYRRDGTAEFYVGSSSRLGVDLGSLNARRLIFRVGGVDPSEPGQLAGRFLGVAAGATVGFGASTEALVGGATGRAVLTPLDNFDDTGINFTAAVGAFDLTYAGSEPRSLRERY